MTTSPLPSNAEVAATLREIYGTEVVMQGTPSLVAEAMLTVMRIALGATQNQPARFNGEQALAEFEAKPGKCSRCGFSREDHSYNGACYGLCGKFVEVKK